MFGWIKAAVGFGLKLYGWIKGSDSKPDLLSDALPFAISQLLPAVKTAIAYKGLDTKEKLDAWLDAVDAATGDDPAALNLIPGMPAKVEEDFFDHAKEMARCYGYCLLRVPGYFEG
jgi:hypothetical protein